MRMDVQEPDFNKHKFFSTLPVLLETLSLLQINFYFYLYALSNSGNVNIQTG